MTPWRSKFLNLIIPGNTLLLGIENNKAFTDYKNKKSEEKTNTTSTSSVDNSDILLNITTEFPKFDNSYTIKDLQDKIDKSNLDTVEEASTLPPKYLVATCESEIARMVKGDSLLRLADMWFGKDKYSTVTGFSIFSNKQMNTLQPLRSDLALSFSTSMSPVDTVQVEIICHISKMRTMVQRLAIITEITPSVPLMNTALAAILQPIHHNKGIYEAYGIKADDLCKVNPDVKEMLKAYSSVPIQVHIDDLNISYAGPRDIRMLITLTRVLTTNSYGDRILYCQTMQDSYKQHMFMKNFQSEGDDTDQIKAYGSVFNVYNEAIDEMVNALKDIPKDQGDNYAPYMASVAEVTDGDTITIYNNEKTDGKQGTTTIRLFGIDAPETEAFAKYLIISDNTNTNIIPVQPYSKEAKAALQKLLYFKGGKPTANSKIIVQPFGSDTTGRRILAELYTPTKDGSVCINLEMVKNGLAHVSSQEKSTMDTKSMAAISKYYDAQEIAKTRKYGVWSLPDDQREIPSAFRERVKESIKTNTHKRRLQS